MEKVKIKTVEGYGQYPVLYQVWYGKHFIDACTTKREAQQVARKVSSEEKRKEKMYGK